MKPPITPNLLHLQLSQKTFQLIRHFPSSGSQQPGLRSRRHFPLCASFTNIHYTQLPIHIPHNTTQHTPKHTSHTHNTYTTHKTQNTNHTQFTTHTSHPSTQNTHITTHTPQHTIYTTTHTFYASHPHNTNRPPQHTQLTTTYHIHTAHTKHARHNTGAHHLPPCFLLANNLSFLLAPHHKILKVVETQESADCTRLLHKETRAF